MRLKQDELLNGVKRIDGSRRDKGCGITSPRDLKVARDKLEDRGWIKTIESRDGMMYEIVIDREDSDEDDDFESVKCTSVESAKCSKSECILFESQVQNALSDNKELRSIKNSSEGIQERLTPPPVRPEEFANVWNRCRGGLPRVESFTESRRKKIQTRVRQGVSLEKFEEAVKQCAMTPFLAGSNNQGWSATFDWLVENDRNIVKVLENNYKGTGGKNGNITTSKPIFEGFVNGGRAETPSRGQLPVRSMPALGPPAAR